MRARCPECGTTFECDQEKEGKKVACPDCGERFVAEAQTRVKAGSAPATPRGKRDADDDDGRNDDRPRRKSKRKKDDSMRTVWLVLGIAAGVMFALGLAVVACAGIFGFFGRRAAQEMAEAARAQQANNVFIEQPFQPGNPFVEMAGPDGASRIVGGAFDAPFRDPAPEGGLLVGLELAIVNKNSIKAVRPIFLANGQEVKGVQHGNAPATVTVKAKPGYAIGSAAINAGLWIDGMSVTFARVNNGKLDPADTYQSEHHGGNGGGRTVFGDNARPVIGIVGKSNGRDCTGFGLLFK